jgi:hypothetical protein
MRLTRFLALTLFVCTLWLGGCASGKQPKANTVNPNRLAKPSVATVTRAATVLHETPTPEPAMTVHGDDTDILKSTHLHAVFWGTSWASQSTLRDNITRAMSSIEHDTAYFSPLSDYSASITPPVSIDSTTVNIEPGHTKETPGNAREDLRPLFENGTIARDVSNDELFIFVLPKSTVTDYGDAYHASLHAQRGDDSFDVAFAIIQTQDFMLADISDSLSHETVEGISNPWNSGVYGDAGPCDPNADKATCEVADACAGASSTDPRTPEGFTLAPYWVQKRTACLPGRSVLRRTRNK